MYGAILGAVVVSHLIASFVVLSSEFLTEQDFSRASSFFKCILSWETFKFTQTVNLRLLKRVKISYMVNRTDCAGPLYQGTIIRYIESSDIKIQFLAKLCLIWIWRMTTKPNRAKGFMWQ